MNAGEWRCLGFVIGKRSPFGGRSKSYAPAILLNKQGNNRYNILILCILHKSENSGQAVSPLCGVHLLLILPHGSYVELQAVWGIKCSRPPRKIVFHPIPSRE